MRNPFAANKYRARRTTVDNVVFHSAKEARRYIELKALEQGGVITKLQLQPKYPLVVNGLRIATYVADFVFIDDQGQTVVEDVKSEGTKTPVYRLKKKIMKALYNIDVVEM
jgi:hypothetical protein